jgi:hypothetical protein
MHQDEGSFQSQNTTEQVAPRAVAEPNAHPADLQATSCAPRGVKTNTPTLIDKGRTKKTPRPKKRRRKVGGWPSTTGFRYPEVKSIMEGAFRIRSSGKDFTAFVTIKPPTDLAGDQVRKLWCRRKLYNFQRKLARRDLPFVALSVFEKPLDGQLHLHALIHVPMKFFPELQKMENPPEIDVKLRHSKSLSYILKNRLPTHRDFEPTLTQTLRRKRGASFRGKRWLFSRDAQSIIRRARPGTM